MRRSWSNKNVDLKLLVDRIGEYFKIKDFEVIKAETENGCQIFAENSPFFKMNGYVNVVVEGDANNFSIIVELCSKGEGNRFPSVMLTTFFGGGFFLLRNLESREAWIMLEKELWKQIDKNVFELVGSAGFS